MIFVLGFEYVRGSTGYIYEAVPKSCYVVANWFWSVELSLFKDLATK